MTVLKFGAQESAALIMLAAALLAFRTFRERYLLVWIVGWLSYVASRLPAWEMGAEGFTRIERAVCHAEFVLAVCLFAAAVVVYTCARRWILPLFLISLCMVGFAVFQALFWPGPQARMALEIGYRLVLVAACLRVLWFRWARWDIGSVLLSSSLLALHLDWAVVDRHIPPGLGLLTDMMLGLGMMLIVFDDSRMRTRRLAVVNALTTSITRAQQHGPMMATALEELKSLMHAKAAWFRLIEGDGTVLTQHIGLSQSFLQGCSWLNNDETQQRVVQSGSPEIVKARNTDPETRAYLRAENLHHVVLVPVSGKKQVVGILAIGHRHHLIYTPEEMDFLATAGQQLGMAVENLRLVEQILRSQRQWINTFDSIQDLILVHDSEFRIIKANHALLQRLVQAPADVADQSCETVLPHKEGAWSGCPYCTSGSLDFHEGVDPCFGGFSMISSSSYSEQGSAQKGTIHVVRDVTDRRAAEEKYRLLFEQVQEGVFVATLDGRLLDCNDAFVRMLGYGSSQELMAENLETALYASRDQRDAFHREIETRNYARNFELTLRRRDGSLMAALISCFVSRNEHNQIERYQGFLLDVTEKKRAEDEIRRRNRELNALNAMAVIATQSFDLDEILNLTLRQMISLFGAETGSIYLAETDGTTFRRRAGWGQRSEARGHFSEIALPAGFGDLVMRSRTEVITEEYLPHLPPLVADFVRADNLGSWIWVLLWGKDAPIGVMGISNREAREYSSSDENLLVAIGRQLATTIEKVRLYEETCRAYEDLRRTQEQLLQSEKMSAVGQLIAGVAHELNNPLTAILGYAQLLESEPLNQRAAEFVSKVFKQAQRTHRVVQNLLSFARQRKPLKQNVDLTRVVEEALALRDYDLKVNDIHLERDFLNPLPSVTADSHQLEQVFLNVINNALDAMLETGHGGSLKIKLYAEDKYVLAEFRDSGPGIDEPKRIFDPFYTTKDVGKGTGLGLSICYGIVKEHGGDITAQNEPGGGALIQVRLPVTEQVGALECVPAAAPPAAIEGRVLLVDNEEAVLEFERDVLTGAGAEVTVMMKLEDARARLLEKACEVVVMNGKSSGGWTAVEWYGWLKENCSGMERRVLFTFSSPPDPETRAFLQENNLPCLVKPFEVADLINQARSLAQKAQAAGAS